MTSMRLIPLTLAAVLLPAMVWAQSPTGTPPGLNPEIRMVPLATEMELPALDVAKLRAEDEKNRALGKPPRYAVPVDVQPVTPSEHGTWQVLADGRQVWRYRIHARQATSVEPAFTTFRLPEGASLYVHGNDGKRVRGPYTHEDNESHGQLWVPIVEGEMATVELVLEPGVAPDAVELEMTRVLQGYDEFWKADASTKVTNSCNVDVACKQAEDWEDPIASVARITIGISVCTGQMVNDTVNSGRPLFLTANHCGIRESNAASLKVYWNFENSTCRDISGSPGDAPPGDDDPNDDVQSGAFFRSRFVSSDFTLVELDEMPKPEWDVYWSGWDRRDRTYKNVTGIHHPDGDEKRISFERDQLDIIGGAQPLDILDDQPIYQHLQEFDLEDTLPRSHFMVNDWDLGVTEGGSSGSGLWNQQRRLIGTLHGGGRHQCDDNDFDWYGRFWMSWEGGGTPGTSLKPWLDPVGRGDKFNDGRDGDCPAPNVFIADNVNGPKAGELFTLSAEGGSNAVELYWDVDGDGVFDAQGRDVNVRFDGGGDRQVKLIANNLNTQCGTTKSKTLTVRAPDLKVASIGKPSQLSGDGDNLIEPGERWDVPVTLSNQGDVRAVNARGVFRRAGILDDQPIGPDGFGYTATDSRSSSACPYQFHNIADNNNRVDFTASSGFPSQDDGGSEPFELDNFPFYNGSAQAVVMSSNGYLAPSAARNGGDFSNDCPLPAPVDNDPGNEDPGSFPPTGHARIAPYHDDLVTGIAWELHYDDCPRPGVAPGGNGACRIFQWNNVEVLDPGTYPSGNPQPFELPKFEFQAILYEGSGEIVYQYGANAPVKDSTPTVGIQDNRANSGLTWGCSAGSDSQGLPRPNPGTAVCFFHPDKAAPDFDADAFSLDEPALGFGNIPPGGNRTARVAFEIAGDAPCGADIGIGLHGVVFDGGFSAGPGTVFIATLGGDNAQCKASAKSGATKAEPIDFKPGMYFNSARSGHGADIHRNGDTVAITWFTYGPDRRPAWYQAVGTYEDNQVVADLLKFTEETRTEGTKVGEVILTFTDAEHVLFNWTLNGEAGGEPFAWFLFDDSGPPSSQQTGLWYPPSQTGWGMSFNTQGGTEVTTTYFYGANGEPVWAQGSKDNPNADTHQLRQFKGPCPGCDWAAPESQPVGTLSREFDNATDGSVTTDITLGTPLDGEWDRGPVDITILTAPLE